MKMNNEQITSVISGVGRYLPERIVTSEEVEEMAGYSKYGMRSGIIKMLTGTEQRHYAAENEYSSDIGYRAAVEALDKSGLHANDIDAIIFGSVTQDFAEPATANVIADRLGANKCYVFDVKNACNAFLSGVDIADSLIKTGKAENVLVVSGEAFSKWIKFKYDDIEELKKRSPVTLSLGDGGGAFVISANKGTDRGIQKTCFHTYADLWNNNVMWGGGVRYPHDIDKMYIPGTTKALVDKHISVGVDYLKKITNMTNWTFEDVDMIVPTQVAKWIVGKTLKDLEFPAEKTVSVIHKFGNVGASNVPLATYEAIQSGQLQKGSKTVMYGGAVGFSIGCVSVIL